MIFRNIGHLLTLEGAVKKDGRRIQESDLGMIKNAAIVTAKNKIIWLGPDKKIPKSLARKKQKEINLNGETVLPALTECHTHLIFSGSRAAEFELRNTGVSYQEIAARGGGILSTMKKTRKDSFNQLVESSIPKINNFIKQGATSIEIKTGYALDLKNEIKCLKVIQELQAKFSKINIISTFLGAHAKPPEFQTHSEYLGFLAKKVLPEIKKKKLSRRVDIFIEKSFFEKPESEEYLLIAKEHGFDLCIHADQLSLSGGSELAIKHKALSADHVIQINENLIHDFSQSNTTAVLLPAADLYMKCNYPPARKLIDAGARVALATDFNPGSSPTQDISLVGLLARLEMKMTLPEVIVAYTFNAAKVLNLNSNFGFLSTESNASFISINKDWTDLFYSIGDQNPTKVCSNGHILF